MHMQVQKTWNFYKSRDERAQEILSEVVFHIALQENELQV